MQRHFHSSMAALFSIYSRIFRQSMVPTIANTSIHLFFNISGTHFTQKLPFTVRTFGLQRFDLSPVSQRVVDGLITFFTQQRFQEGNSGELSHLGTQLTPEIVEAVLKGIRSWKIALKFFNWAKSQDGYFHNCYTYNAMASILSGARQNAPMKTLVLDVMNSCCYMTPGALGFLIRCLGSVGLVEEANVLFNRVREMGLCFPNSYSYNCLLEAIAKSSLCHLAEMRLDEMRGFRWSVDKYTLTPILQVYCNAREFEKALMVFKDMLEKGWADVHVLSILVLSFSKWGEVAKAFELIERMEESNLRLNEKTFYVLIHGFISNYRVDMALKLFDKMRGSGYSPDIAAYDALIGGLCKSEEVQKALHLFSEMKSSGICPDIGILTKLLSCVGEEELMVQLLEESGDSLNDESVKLLFISVLNGLVSNGLVDRALDLVKMMIEGTSQNDCRLEMFFKDKRVSCLNLSSFSIVINALCQSSRLGEALQLFRAMDKLHCQKDSVLYNNLIDALCYADRVTDSLDLLTDMKQSDIKPTHFTYNAIYGYYCRKGDVTGAIRIVKEMCVYRYDPWIKNSTILVKQLCKHGKAAEASNFLDEMVQEGLVPHLIPYFAAVDGFFKHQKVDQALELYHNVCSRGYRPDVVAYNILINGLCKANSMSEAENMLNEMLAGGLVPSTVTYNSLIDGWCKNGNIDQALVCLSRMAGEDREPNVITYTTLIDGMCNAGRPDDALMLWNKMEGEGCSPNRITFMALITGLCKNNMPDMGLFYLRQMEEKELKADNFVYIVLMDSFLSNNNPASAFAMLKEIFEKNMFPNPVDRNYTLVKDAITKLGNDPLTSCNVNKLLAQGGISTFSSLGV